MNPSQATPNAKNQVRPPWFECKVGCRLVVRFYESFIRRTKHVNHDSVETERMLKYMGANPDISILAVKMKACKKTAKRKAKQFQETGTIKRKRSSHYTEVEELVHEKINECRRGGILVSIDSLRSFALCT